MNEIGEGISVIDIEQASGTELLSLFGELIVRDKFGEEDIDKPDNDVVLYQTVWNELENRLKCHANYCM